MGYLSDPPRILAEIVACETKTVALVEVAAPEEEDADATWAVITYSAPTSSVSAGSLNTAGLCDEDRSATGANVACPASLTLTTHEYRRFALDRAPAQSCTKAEAVSVSASIRRIVLLGVPAMRATGIGSWEAETVTDCKSLPQA
jgi:hypothetical protein